jgi:hypothetical protein
MTTVLPSSRSPWDVIGAHIGQNLSQNFPQSVQEGYKQAVMNQQMNQRKQAVGQQFGEDVANLPTDLQKIYINNLLQQQGKESLFNKKLDLVNQFLNRNGEGTNQSQNGPSSSRENQTQFDLTQIPDEEIAKLSVIDPNAARIVQQQKDVALREKRSREEFEYKKTQEEQQKRTDKEKEYFKLNEPKVMELAQNSRKLKQEEGRYNRLGELFSDPSKFPSSFTAALFTKDGQINDLVYSQLTPEAQEAVKLIIDSTSNIKDTYGARVTNFDLQTYLRKLPSLLNSPEGKMRVLRDLKIINQLNQLYENGIQDIFDEAGGTDKIPFSVAEKKYQKKYGTQEKELIDQFVSPEKGMFKQLPDANKNLGKKIKNTETGEILISDGAEWKPYKG